MRDFTRIVILLDRSGSMNTCRESTIQGLNTFIQEQKKVKGDASIKLVQFDQNGLETSIETTFDKNIKDVKELTQEDFQPRGGTPLYDAQALVIDALGDELRKLQEVYRPDKVIFVTITDGYENASRKNTAEQIKAKIEHQKSKYSWDFVYIGANQDAIYVGQTVGLSAAKAMNFNAACGQTVGATYSNLASYVTRGRTSKTMEDFLSNSWTKEERNTSLNEK